MSKKFSPEFIYLFFSGISSFLFTLVFTISSIYYIEIIEMTPFQLVFVGTVLELVYFAFEIPTGIVADVYSRKLSIIMGIILTGIGFILEGVFPLYIFVLVSQVLWGIGATFLSGATEAWIADFLEKDRLELIYIRASQIGNISALIGVFVSVFMASKFIQLPIIISGILFLILGFLLFIFMPESNFTPIVSKELNSWRKMTMTFSHSLRFIKKSNILVLILLATFTTGLASEGLDRLWIAHFIENFSFPNFLNISLVMWIGIINSSGLIISIFISQLIISRLDDKDENKSTKLLFFINLIQGLTICIFALAGNFNIAFVSYLSIYMLRTINEPLNSALVSKVTDANIMSTVISTQGQINSIGQIIGGPIIGIIATRFSISYGILTTGIIILPSAFFYFMINKESFKKNPINFSFEYSSKDSI